MDYVLFERSSSRNRKTYIESVDLVVVFIGYELECPNHICFYEILPSKISRKTGSVKMMSKFCFWNGKLSQQLKSSLYLSLYPTSVVKALKCS